MNRPTLPVSTRSVAGRFSPYAARLQGLFAAMDLAYAAAAEAHGFRCAGCEDNCCRTRFYHHTYLELFYLHRGLAGLKPEARAAVRSRAVEICRSTEPVAAIPGVPQRMCPLNSAGRCELYEYRPMICRLHGIPHSLRHPDGSNPVGPGCEAFHRQCGSGGGSVLDRTPHYRALAELEQEFRRAMGWAQRLKMTVAEMIVRCDF